jgi:lysozyme family protein
MAADFTQAHEKTVKNEGGYSNDPTDAGGETWKGISRRFHPLWPGWAIIEAEKKHGLDGLNDRLKNNDRLYFYELHFYREQFWNRFNGDAIPLQSIADELFDTSVNMGVHRAVGFLQGALNLLNRNQKNYPDIIEDGVFGPKTLNTLTKHLSLEKENPTALLKLMNTLQGMHYVEYMREHPEQEEYARGWMKRT